MISIRTPAWGATGVAFDPTASYMISIHTPTRGATTSAKSSLAVIDDFNPHSRVGSDMETADFKNDPSIFQSTLPRGERPQSALQYHSTALFQSTLPRGERLPCDVLFSFRVYISIHTPAWGATRKYSWFFIISSISIHTPAWGATVEIVQEAFRTCISIHTPAWGATHTEPTTSDTGKFQSTLPRGERPYAVAVFASGDLISIHTPAWGATRHGCDKKPVKKISIHTPAWGATCSNFTRLKTISISIHTPAWGATTAGCKASAG